MYVPFDYQEECLHAIDRVRGEGSNKALIVMATGLGKMVTMAFSAKRWHERGITGRVLFLCHNNDILAQAKKTFKAINGASRTYGFFHGKEKHLHHVDFLFASFQTMENSRELFDPKEFSYVIVDEGHHAQAETFRGVIEYFVPEFLLGATATPDRLDMKDIRDIFGQEVFYLPLEEALAKGYLTPVDYRLLADEIVLEKALMIEERRVSLAELNRMVFVPRRDDEVAEIIQRHTSEFADPRTIIFCTSVRHCEHLAQFIPQSFAIHSKIPDKERAVRLEMFRQGMISTILVVDAFNEGIDIPQANVIVFLRSTQSRNIFLQQLGRGVRKSDGKDRVVVLDFVANCERIKMILDLNRTVEELSPPDEKRKNGESSREPITLNLNSVVFEETIVPLMNLMDRVRPNFYLTWQDASVAARALGIDTYAKYRRGAFRVDARLPAYPNEHYKDFPGWNTFCGREEKNIYETWQEASIATIALGIDSSGQYRSKRGYKKDPRLPGDPRDAYDNFPGWNTFLGKKEKNVYETWQEASRAAQALQITSSAQYMRSAYKADPRLPFDPTRAYGDFPGWLPFLGKAEKDWYPTWKAASAATKALHIRRAEYHSRYQEDPRLPSNPEGFYEDFPGWGEFSGDYKVRVSRENRYLTWRAASEATRRLGITRKVDYKARYKEDRLLPSSPPQAYKDFPGWAEFLGRK